MYTPSTANERADFDDPAAERFLASAGHLHFDRHLAALNFVRIVLALLDCAFDVHRVQPQQREDRVARLHPFVLLAFEFFDDAVERRGDRRGVEWPASAASSSACLVMASNLASFLSWRDFSMPRTDVVPFELGLVELDLRDRPGCDFIGFEHQFVLGFGDGGLGGRVANFDIVLPAFVGGAIGGVGGLLLHLRLAVVDLADDLAGANLRAFLHRKCTSTPGSLAGSLIASATFTRPGITGLVDLRRVLAERL